MSEPTTAPGLARDHLEITVVGESAVCHLLSGLLARSDLQEYSDTIDAHWTWGDTDYTLVRADTFLDRISEVLPEAVVEQLDLALTGVDFINLEG